MDIGSIIKSAREKSGMTQKELAERMECSQPLIYAWEAGKKNILAKDFFFLVEILSAEEILCDFLLSKARRKLEKKLKNRLSEAKKIEEKLRIISRATE